LKQAERCSDWWLSHATHPDKIDHNNWLERRLDQQGSDKSMKKHMTKLGTKQSCEIL
jgi:hypothetical protein